MHLGKIRFFAHSTDRQDQSDWEPLLDHLKAVARTAGENAAKFGAGELGRTAGLFHDLGKYSDKFQKRIRGSGDKVATRYNAPVCRRTVDRYFAAARYISAT
jgi:CRISPR-associated endonuclease/helicase Cas3